MADRILVTGANGFVGTALCRCLQESGFLVRGAVRDRAKLPQSRVSDSNDMEWVLLHDRSDADETKLALQAVQVVVHLAARVHVMTDDAADPLLEFRRVNTDWTERLARAAASQGVRRFVYLSSIKVNGEQSLLPFTEQDAPNPHDPYGVSKWEAEQALAGVSLQTSMELVVVRSPLVYGPGVGGNFLQLLNILRRGVPLPLALVQNRRSLVYRGNLVDALTRCVREVRAARQTYLVSDGEDLSTPELIRRLGKALGKTVHLWPAPLSLLRGLGRLAGKQAVFDRLLGSLQVDPSKIRQELNWCPPFSVDRGLAETAAWYLARSSPVRLTT
ncbi:MAG TPA: SDR family oxidoreductase [Nitrospiraceae bacterium]|nr:SDR family oxidoreductase [Nitrospiraceae bacterium]